MVVVFGRDDIHDGCLFHDGSGVKPQASMNRGWTSRGGGGDVARLESPEERRMQGCGVGRADAVLQRLSVIPVIRYVSIKDLLRSPRWSACGGVLVEDSPGSRQERACRPWMGPVMRGECCCFRVWYPVVTSQRPSFLRCCAPVDETACKLEARGDSCWGRNVQALVDLKLTRRLPNSHLRWLVPLNHQVPPGPGFSTWQ